MSSLAEGTDSSSDVARAALEKPALAPPGKSFAERANSAELGGGAETQSGWQRIAHSMSVGQRLAAGAATGLWLGDVALLAPERTSAGWTRWLTAVGAALFVALTTALVAGAVLGLVLVPTVTKATGVLKTSLQRVHEGDRGARHAFAAHVLGVVGLVCTASWASYRVALATELGFSGPRLMAAALTGSHLMFAAALALGLPWSLWLARELVEGASRVPGLRWVGARPWWIPRILAAAVLFVGAVLAFAHKTELAALPWQSVMSAPGALLGLAVAYYLPRARGAWGPGLTRAAFAFEVLALCGGAAAAARLHPELTITRRLAFDRALSGKLGYAAWTAAFDFDGDGQLSMLGGGDCAPFDRRRYSGAVDIPGNGIDEDCDGVDLRPLSIQPRARMRVGQDALPKRPTIVFVTIDALAAPRLTALGAHESIMPNVDELAENAGLFTHCFSQGPSTRLSFPSMFTSRWDSQLTHLFAPVHPYSIAASDRQLQDVLNDAGYETVAVIPNSYFSPSRWASMTRGFQRVDPSAIPAGKHNAEQVTAAALRALSSPSSDRPMYLWVHYYDAHSPYQLPPGMKVSQQTDEALYNAELTFIDRALGPLIAAVKARPDPTYLFLTADHATVFHPDPSLRRGHYGYDLYTATLHVPLIVWGPGIRAGSRTDGVVSTMDVAPTIADMLHLSTYSFEGTSLLPELLAGKGDKDRVLFHEFYLPERGFRGEDPLQIVSVRNDRYNLVLDRAKGMYEFYDYTADYFERTDLYDTEARSPEAMRLKSLLSSFVLRFHNRWRAGTEMPGSNAAW